MTVFLPATATLTPESGVPPEVTVPVSEPGAKPGCVQFRKKWPWSPSKPLTAMR